MPHSTLSTDWWDEPSSGPVRPLPPPIFGRRFFSCRLPGTRAPALSAALRAPLRSGTRCSARRRRWSACATRQLARPALSPSPTPRPAVLVLSLSLRPFAPTLCPYPSPHPSPRCARSRRRSGGIGRTASSSRACAQRTATRRGARLPPLGDMACVGRRHDAFRIESNLLKT